MQFYFGHFFNDLIIPQTLMSLIPGFIVLLYGLWLHNKRRRSFRFHPFFLALAIIVFWSTISFISIYYFGIPQNYVDSLRTISDYEVSISMLPYDFAIVVTALSFKFVASQFLATRLSRTYIGLSVAFVGMFLVVF